MKEVSGGATSPKRHVPKQSANSLRTEITSLLIYATELSMIPGKWNCQRQKAIWIISLHIKEDIKTDHTGRANGSRFHISESTMELARSGEEKLNEVYLL